MVQGCTPPQAVRDFWRGTKSYYYEYLNTPASIDISDAGRYKAYELHLAEAMVKVEQELRQLMRAMDDSDRGPDEAWANALIRRFPWLGGLALLDGRGRIMAKIPQVDLKGFEASPLFDEVKGQKKTDLRAYVQDNPLGPEIYLGKPIYVSGDLAGIVVVHFDMRALVARVTHPGELVVIVSDLIVWPGAYVIEETPLQTVDWNKMFAGGTSGLVGDSSGEFFWVSSYLANIRLGYAVLAGGSFPLAPEQLNVLKQADAFTIPK
jgi:hypothetical protein